MALAIFHLWLEAERSGKQQMFPFSSPHDCVGAQYVKMIFWQEALCGTVAPFVLYAFHSVFQGALFIPKIALQSLGGKARTGLERTGFNLGNRCLERALGRGTVSWPCFIKTLNPEASSAWLFMAHLLCYLCVTQVTSEIPA